MELELWHFGLCKFCCQEVKTPLKENIINKYIFKSRYSSFQNITYMHFIIYTEKNFEGMWESQKLFILTTKHLRIVIN